MGCSKRLIFVIIFVLALMIVPPLTYAADAESIGEHLKTEEITISKDTVRFDAAVFVSPDCMVLKDLLASLPGFEIDDNQQIYAFGQQVTDWKINGVSSLFESADIVINTYSVGRIKYICVYDDVSTEEEDSGIDNMEAPTKAIDIILDEDALYKPTANIKFLGGYGSSRFLYNSAASYTKYTAKGNLGVFISGADNLQIENETEDGIEGMLRAYNAGFHYYTEGINSLTIKVAASYNSTHTEEDKVASRQTLFGTSRLHSETTDYCTLDKRRAGAVAELASAFDGGFYFEITPKFYYTGIESQSLFNTEVLDGESSLNFSQSQGSMRSDEFSHSTDFYMRYSSSGKPGRVLLFTANYFIDNRNSDIVEHTEISSLANSTEGAGVEITDLLYDRKYMEKGLSGKLEYVEPIGRGWYLNAELASQYTIDELTDNVYSGLGDAFIYDETHSAYSQSRYFLNNAHLLAQYEKGETLLQFGGYGQVVNNEVLSRTSAAGNRTGVGEHIWDWSPFVKFRSVGKHGRSVMVNYIGSSSNLSNSLLMSVPDISDPSHITFGNIYLKPGFVNNINFYYNFNSKRKFNLMYLNFNICRERRAVVDATWFDKDGVQYSVPVNAQKVTRNFSLEYNFSNIPIDRAHNLILNLSLAGERGQYYGYQAIGESNVVDVQNFDYSRFMKRFWGESADGSDFYSGRTGFRQSRTINTLITGDMNFEYGAGNFTFTLGVSATRNILKYTFDDRANMNTWVVGPYFLLEYETEGGLKFETELDYEMYDGYSPAYGEPGLMWNFYASKRFRNFTFRASVVDILDDASYLHRMVARNYVEESVAKHLGRRIMLG
ncbi:MAG: outer membrane beta-barrel protein, partial [Bacteroidales bacterium]|nr:outer membrane beta-barrel protein [Bacteroidales bacterium]